MIKGTIEKFHANHNGRNLFKVLKPCNRQSDIVAYRCVIDHKKVLSFHCYISDIFALSNTYSFLFLL